MCLFSFISKSQNISVAFETKEICSILVEVTASVLEREEVISGGLLVYVI